MTYNSKLKNCSSYKPPEGKFSWAIALGDLVKKTKKNLEGIDSSVSMNDIVIDGKCCNKDERLFQKSNTYRLMGLGRCSSSFESRNSTCRFATNKVNSNSIDSHDSSNHNIAASFDDNQNLNTNFKININYLNYILQDRSFFNSKELPPKVPETFGMKHQPLTTAFMSQTHQFDKRSLAHEFSKELSLLK